MRSGLESGTSLQRIYNRPSDSIHCAVYVFAYASKQILCLCDVAQTYKPRQSGLLAELRVSDSLQSMYQEADNAWIQFPFDLNKHHCI